MTIHKKIGKNYDEQDTMFSRMSLDVKSDYYDKYYEKRAELKEIDDALRDKPDLYGEGTATYDLYESPVANSNFKYLADIMRLVEPPVSEECVDVKADDITKLIKTLAISYGAGSVGIAKMDNDMYYSHRGRREHRGMPITRNMKHKYGIAFTIPMNTDSMLYAPGLPAGIEVTNAYVKAATIGMQLAYYIGGLGYKVRNHMDANYLVIAPRVAVQGGLGEFGRHGLLVTPKYGPNVRLGVVTTDMPLIADEPIDFGVKEFCKACKKCVRTCPGKAITDSNDEGLWQINHESCYNRWRSLGTDCSICLSNCPYTYEMVDIKDIEGSLKDYEDKFGIRPFNKNKSEWYKS